MEDASVYLKAPGDVPEDATNGFVNLTDVFDYVSPSAWIRTIITEITGVDIMEWAIQFFTGDWEALWKFGDALNNLAQFMQALGIDVQEGAIDLDGDWDGNAADAANAYFTNLAVALSTQQNNLRAAGEGYHKAAAAAYVLAGQVANLIQAAADDAIIAGLATGAGTATIETGVGAFLGYTVAAAAAGRVVKKINKASKLINTAITVIMAAFGGMNLWGHEGGDLTAIQLPATAFQPTGA